MQEDLINYSKGARFGWPKPARVEEFSKLMSTATAHHRMIFKGEMREFPIIRISIDLPKYRLENGRTSSAQEEYLAKNPSIQRDLFTADPELWTSQEAQHNLLLEMAKLSDLQKTFEDPKNIQVEALLLDENGFVINGNRRLAAWRELVYKDKIQYAHFENIDVVVLPHCDSKEIDRIEARLQISKDIRADYSWDARAKMMQAKQKRDNFSNQEIAQMYQMAEEEIKELFDMLAYAEEYLKSRGNYGYWSKVSDRESAFQKLVQYRPKIQTIGKQELFKEIAFILIDKPEEAGGRLYAQIPGVYDHFDKVKEKLIETFPVTPINEQRGELEEIFGVVSGTQNEDSLNLPLSREIGKLENNASVRSLVVDILETQRQLKRDSKGANFLITCCAKAQAALMAAIADLSAETKTQGVEEQLNTIEEYVKKIREFTSKNA